MPDTRGRERIKPRALWLMVFSEEEVAYFDGDDGVSERTLPLADWASLFPAISDSRE